MVEARDFGRYLKELRLSRQLTTRQVEIYSGVSNSYLSLLERGKRGIPSPEILKKLAPVYKTPYEDLMVAAGYLKKETVFYSPSQPAEVYIENDPLLSDAIPLGKQVRIPVYGEIRAGDPAFIQDEIIDWAYISADQVKAGKYFYLRVKGDSMEGEKIYEGDYVLVRCQPTLEDGHIGVVGIIGESASEYGGEATIKKFYRKGSMVVLQPANSKYDPIIVPVDDVHVIGEVIKVERWLNGGHI